MSNATHSPIISMLQIKRVTLWVVIVTGSVSLTPTRVTTGAETTTIAATYDCPTGGTDCCPKCKLEIKKEAVKKYFYTVECKTICIPKVTCPWEKPPKKVCTGSCDSGDCQCPVPCKGARIRTVKVLHKFEYECEKCKYKWIPTCLECDCSSKADQPEATAGEEFAPPIPPADRAVWLKDLFDAIPLWK